MTTDTTAKTKKKFLLSFEERSTISEAADFISHNADGADNYEVFEKLIHDLYEIMRKTKP